LASSDRRTLASDSGTGVAAIVIVRTIGYVGQFSGQLCHRHRWQSNFLARAAETQADTSLHYPAGLNGEVHHDGQIWSRALWDIRQALGNVKADTVILQGSFDFPGTTMPDLANRTFAAAQQLYGTAAANVVHRAFADRGIL
jgi:hypothetical protein